jgi:hypothetical protein
MYMLLQTNTPEYILGLLEPGPSVAETATCPLLAFPTLRWTDRHHSFLTGGKLGPRIYTTIPEIVILGYDATATLTLKLRFQRA